MSVALHHLLSDFAAGDALGTITLSFRDISRELGFRSEIFSNVIDPRVAVEARPADELETVLRPGDAVMYHLSIGSPVARLFERLPARKLLYYQNITPAAYYRGVNERVVARIEQAHADARRLMPVAELVMAPTAFNLAEARAFGADRAMVVPSPLPVSRLHPRPALAPPDPVLLFVGRIAPNKGHADLLRVLAALRGTVQPTARLVVVGHSLDTEPYLRGLWRLAESLGVTDAVDMPGGRLGLSDAELGARYASSSVFLCMSEHEGICVPVVEAMSFEVPVVAYAAGAVPETVGEGGILLETRDPLVWAATVDRILRDGVLRARLTAAGRRRSERVRAAPIAELFQAALAEAGVRP
ncbi:MAG: glycosyltransferase [Chloroflexi bacterium]|nr:MAG: glycosyltransferase [Chloroflexota bacterium]